MAEVPVAYHPELTAEQSMKIFQKHFQKYELFKADKWPYSGSAVKRDFAIKKNAWIGVTVKLKQEPDKTSFIITYCIPSLIRAAFCGFYALMFLRSKFKAMENEVKSFIEGAEEFK